MLFLGGVGNLISCSWHILNFFVFKFILIIFDWIFMKLSRTVRCINWCFKAFILFSQVYLVDISLDAGQVQQDLPSMTGSLKSWWGALKFSHGRFSGQRMEIMCALPLMRITSFSSKMICWGFYLPTLYIVTHCLRH